MCDFSSFYPPHDYIPIILADRFQGTSPMDYRYMPADDRAWLLKMLGVEGEVNKIWQEATEGVAGDTDVFIAEFEYELWDDD